MDQAEVTSKTPELQGLPETSRFICPNGVCPAVVTTRRDGALAPTMDDVAAVFHLPIDRAAKQLNVGQTWLKHMCREHGVPRWPFRKIQSLLSSAQRLEESIADVDPNSGDPSERERYQKVNEQIQQLYSARAAICRGQCPELSAVSAQDALKAAARRGRAAAASRHMKQAKHESKLSTSDDDLSSFTIPPVTGVALEHTPDRDAAPSQSRTLPICPVEFSMDPPSASANSFDDVSYQHCSNTPTRTQMAKHLNEDYKSTADSPQRNSTRPTAPKMPRMTARSLFPGLDAHTSLGSAAGLLPSAKTFANQLPGSERNGMTAGDFITNLAALNNIVSQQLARPSQARSIEGNDMLQSICSGSPSMSQTSGELHNGDSFKTQDLDIATLLPEEQDLMCFEEFEGSATQQRLPTHYHDTKESVRSTFTALHSLEELLLRPVILEGTSTSTGPTSVSAMENHLMPLKLSSVQTIKPGRWSINTKGAVALLKSRRS